MFSRPCKPMNHTRGGAFRLGPPKKVSPIDALGERSIIGVCFDSGRLFVRSASIECTFMICVNFRIFCNMLLKFKVKQSGGTDGSGGVLPWQLAEHESEWQDRLRQVKAANLSNRKIAEIYLKCFPDFMRSINHYSLILVRLDPHENPILLLL